SDETGLHLLARDGEVATGDAPGCAIYGSAYARMQITSAGGGIAFGAGVTCDGGGISIFSNRSGSLRREAYRDLVLDGPSGRFRLGLLSMVTATLGSLGDNPAYLYGLLDDGARLYVLSPLFHEDGTLRSSWGISKVGSGGYGEVLVESSALSSGLPVDLAASPFPEQISISGDGTVLARVRELNSDSRVLLLYNYYTGITLVRDGSMIEGHTVTVGGSDRVSGIAMDGGQLLASVSVQSPQDGTGQPLRNAIVYLNSIGELSLPIVQGETQALLRGQDPVLLENFENPFGWEMRRNVANASPQTVFIGSISRAGMPQEDAILLLNWFQPVLNLADFNRDGLVTLSDLFAYLVAFFAGEPRADLNGDGVFSPQDIFQFLRIFLP
ncbi:MAG: hypothetical protein KDD64_17435, partial [Bdellovibrionales bacterium]|nr:hypothetical protein [Bdellovibrionales bacterium]